MPALVARYSVESRSHCTQNHMESYTSPHPYRFPCPFLYPCCTYRHTSHLHTCSSCCMLSHTCSNHTYPNPHTSPIRTCLTYHRDYYRTCCYRMGCCCTHCCRMWTSWGVHTWASLLGRHTCYSEHHRRWNCTVSVRWMLVELRQRLPRACS